MAPKASYVYLLHSLENPTKFYIGFTTNPVRRLRQHNGLIKGGAEYTKKHRPWIMIRLISGFLNKTHALQFEWAWQHTKKSKLCKHQLKGKRGLGTYIERKINELPYLLTDDLQVSCLK